MQSSPSPLLCQIVAAARSNVPRFRESKLTQHTGRSRLLSFTNLRQHVLRQLQ
jgi:hypothetical protein